jgi:predicted nucleic acid-binding protein
VILLDTTVLIDVLRGHRAAVEWLAERDTVPWCSQVTRTEVLRGMRSSERGQTTRLLDTLRWADVDAAISARAGELGREYRTSHPHIGVADLLIAATAVVLRADLATGNVRHYPMFPALSAPYDA